MKEVFLALQPQDGERISKGQCLNSDPGTCISRWLYDASLVAQYMQAGWFVYRANGFQRIVDVTVELKMEKQDGCCEASESDNECGR